MKKKEITFISVEEAATRLGISSRRIQQLCKEGKIPDAYRRGNSWKVPDGSLDKLPIKKKNRSILKPIPVGISDFSKVVNEYCYIDKSLLIKEVLDSRPNVLLFTRPHGFMKTLNLDMLKTFFEINEEGVSSVFDELEISKCGDKYLSHRGKYPVINISFKDLQGGDWNAAFSSIKEAIRLEYVRHNELKKSDRLSSFDLARYESIFTLKGEDDEVLFSSSLALLADLLFKRYGKKPILLVDEYDAPFRGSISSLDEKVAPFMRDMFSSLLKDNSRLSYAFIFGVIKGDKLNLFPSYKADSILDERYDKYFGFTESEVRKLLAYYGYSGHFSTIKERYGGYSFGKETMYNPWSVLNYVDDRCAYARAYWSTEDCDELLLEALRENEIETFSSLTNLMLKEPLLCDIDIATLYPVVEDNPQSIYSYLLMGGYLTKKEVTSERGRIYVNASIPNLEVSDLYAQRINESLTDVAPISALSLLEKAIFEGKKEKLVASIEKFLVKSLTSSDNSSELYYPKLMLSLASTFKDAYRLSYALDEEEGRLTIDMKSVKEGNDFYLVLIAAGRVGEEGLQKLSEEELETLLSTHKEKGVYLSIAYSKKKAVTTRKNR